MKQLSLAHIVATCALFTLAAAAGPRPSETTTATPLPTSCSRSTTSVCCQSYTTAGDASAAYLIDSFHIRGTSPDTPVGLTCDTIYSSRDADSCSGDTLCCSDDDYGGLIAIDCSEVDL